MKSPIYNSYAETLLKPFVELPHNENTVRYLGLAQGTFLMVATAFNTFNGLKSRINEYIQQQTKDKPLKATDLANITLLQAFYSREGTTEGQVNRQLPSGFCVALNEYGLLELLYNEALKDEQVNSWIMSLFNQVEGLEHDYNEYMFFHEHLKQK